MAYGSFFPQTYYPTYYGTQQMAHTQPQIAQNQQQNVNTNMIWVQGENAAKSFPVSAGQTVQLMDSEAEGIMYIKSVDPSGMPLPLRIFEYSEKKSQNNQSRRTDEAIGSEEYVSRQEFDEFREDVKRSIKGIKKHEEEGEG